MIVFRQEDTVFVGRDDVIADLGLGTRDLALVNSSRRNKVAKTLEPARLKHLPSCLFQVHSELEGITDDLLPEGQQRLDFEKASYPHICTPVLLSIMGRKAFGEN